VSGFNKKVNCARVGVIIDGIFKHLIRLSFDVGHLIISERETSTFSSAFI
jgi:hypothetical protein